RLEPARGGLGHGHAPAYGTRSRRAQHGALSAAPDAGDPSFGPRNAVHLDCLRSALQGSGCATLDGLARRLLRQRNVRGLLRYARMRAAGPVAVSELGRGAHGDLRFHRGLVQSAASSFGPRLPLADQLRASGGMMSGILLGAAAAPAARSLAGS